MTIPTMPSRSRILIVGRSPGVLAEAVALLRDKGYTAEATNEFDRVLAVFDPGSFDTVVFGGMVPPETKQHLREQISTGNPDMVFIQGLAGIPGVIVAQVEAAAWGHETGIDVDYDEASRSIKLRLDRPYGVAVVALWGTKFVPPEPASTSMTVHNAELPAGSHTIALPAEIPTKASFATVSVGTSVWTFVVGPMPQGLTVASLGDDTDLRRATFLSRR